LRYKAVLNERNQKEFIFDSLIIELKMTLSLKSRKFLVEDNCKRENAEADSEDEENCCWEFSFVISPRSFRELHIEEAGKDEDEHGRRGSADEAEDVADVGNDDDKSEASADEAKHDGDVPNPREVGNGIFAGSIKGLYFCCSSRYDNLARKITALRAGKWTMGSVRMTPMMTQARTIRVRTFEGSVWLYVINSSDWT
jgi:hypothetical protein